MRVYIPIGWWNHEGNSDPIGVFTSEELARAAIELGYDGYDGRTIYICEIDSGKPVGEIEV